MQLPDLIYGITLLTGVEHLSIVGGSNPLTAVAHRFFPYSHSLVATLLWSGLVALVVLYAPIS